MDLNKRQLEIVEGVLNLVQWSQAKLDQANKLRATLKEPEDTEIANLLTSLIGDLVAIERRLRSAEIQLDVIVNPEAD